MDRNDYIIRIVLRARDELTATLARVRSELESFAGTNTNMEASSKRVAQSIDEIGESSKKASQKVVAANKQTKASQGEVEDATKNLEASVAKLHQRWENYQKLVRDGKADREDQIQQLKRFGNEWSNLARQTDVGTEMAVSLGRLSRQATETATQMEQIDRQMETQRRAAATARAAQRKREFDQEIKDRKTAKDKELKDEEDYNKRVAALRDELWRGVVEIDEQQQRTSGRVAQAQVEDLSRVEAARQTLAQTQRKTSEEHEREQQRIMRLNASYDTFIGRLEAGNVSTNEARSTLRRYATEFDRLSRSYETGSAGMRAYGARAEGARAALSEFNNEVRSSRQDVDTHRSLMDRWADSIDRTNFHLASLSAQLRGLAYAAAITFAQQLLTVLAALGGTLVSVAGSAGLAGAALAGGLAAGAAQAIPIVALLVSAFQRVGVVADAVKQAATVAEQQGSKTDATARRAAGAASALANAQDGLISAQQRVKDANRQVAESEDRVAEAQLRVGDATKRLMEARRDARRELTDLILTEREAELAARGASLSQDEAQDALRQALSSGQTGELARRRLSVDEAAVGGERSALQLRRAREDAAAAISAGVNRAPSVLTAQRGVADARKGVSDARQGVEDAVRGVAEAERGVVRAQRSVEAAKRQGDAAGTDAIASVGKLNYLLEQLSPAERRLYNAITRIKETYKREFRGISDIIIDSFTYAVNRADELLRDDDLQRSARNLAGEVAESFREITDAFTDTEGRRQFVFFSDESARNLDVLTDAAISVGRALMNIGEGAAPLLREVVDATRDWAEGFEQSTSNIDDLEGFFDRAGDHLSAWADALGAAWDLLKAIIGVSEGSGLTAIQDFADVMREGADWLRNNSEESSKFFEDARKSSYEVLKVLWALAKAIIDVFDPAHTSNLADFFIDILIPAFQNSIETLGMFVDIIMSFLSLPIIGDLTRLAIEFGIFVRLLRTFSALAFSGKVALLGREATEASPAIKGLFGNLKDVGNYLKGGFTGAIGAVQAAFKALRGGAGIGGAIDAFKDYVRNARRAADAPVPAGGAAGTAAGGTAGGARQPASRRRRIARGAGVVGAVGAGIAISQTGSDDFRDANSGSAGDIPANFAQDLKQIGSSLLSFDLAGAFTGIARGFNGAKQEMYDFSQVADKDFKDAIRDGDVDRLKELADEARKGADNFPEYADSLNQFADKADEAARQADELNGVLKATGRFADDIRREGGIEAEDIVSPNAVTQFLSNLGRMRRTGIDSISDLRQNMRFNLEQISRGINEGSESWFVAMSRNFGSGISSLKDAMRDGRISTEDGMKEINRITRRQMQFVRENMDNLSGDARDRLARNFASARRAVEAQAGGWEKATGDSLRKIRRLMREELKLYGLSEDQARTITRNNNNGKSGQFGATAGGGNEGGAARAMGDAGGRYGFVGNQGERGADSWSNVVNGRPVGRGEFVGNWAHERYMAPAIQAYYGHSFGDTFKRVRGHHAGNVDGRGWPSGYAGGFAGRTPSGGRAVAIPGFPGEFINAKVLGEALALIRRFKLGVTDAFATSGHQGAGHLRTGTAMDVVPGPGGGSWDTVDAAVAYARSRGLTVLYNGVPGHGRGHHAHIELDAGANIAGARMGRIRRQILEGPDSPLRSIGQGAIDNVRNAANARLRRIARRLGGAEGAEDVNLRGVQVGDGQLGIARAILQVGRRMGASAKALLAAIETGIVESGLRNLSYGDRDSVGVFQQRPSQGWTGLQNVPRAAAEFFARAIPNADKYGTAGQLAQSVQRSGFPGRYDEVRNQAVAVLRKLGVKGFQFGGAIAGYGGGDKNVILAEGGEHVWTKEEVARAGGHGVMTMLRSMFGGGKQADGPGYDVGGAVQFQSSQEAARAAAAAALAAARSASRRGAGEYSLPDILPITVEGVVREINKLNRALRGTKRKADESMSKFVARFVDQLNDLTRENGLMDQLTDAIDRGSARRALNLARSQFRVGRGGVIRERLTEEQISNRTIRNLEAEGGDIAAARRAARSGVRAASTRIEEVDDRIARLRQGGVTGRESREIARLRAGRADLVANRRNLRDRIAQFDTDIASNLQARFEAQVNAFQSSVTEISNRYSRANSSLDRRSTIAEALGRTGDVDKIMNERLDWARWQAQELQGKLEEARQRGYSDQAAALEDQIAELQQTIDTTVIQQFQRSVDAVNKTAETGMFFNDIAMRMTQIGNPDFSRRGDLLRQRGNILSEQRAGLQGLLAVANNTGNQGAVEELTKQIAELDAQIAENTDAISDNTREARQYAIDRIANRGSFLGGVFGGLTGIVNTLSTIAGSPNTQALLSLAQNAGQTLAQTGSGLRDQLASIFGVDLRGLTGMDFVNAVQNLDFDKITAGMSDEDRQQFEALIQAIIENEGAVQQNTQELKELTGSQGQTFSSTAWSMFRSAIFNGAGQLLPQYSQYVPQFDTGGTMPYDGLAYLHRGEVITNPMRGQTAGEHHEHFHITTPVQHVDRQMLSRESAWARRTSGR